MLVKTVIVVDYNLASMIMHKLIECAILHASSAAARENEELLIYVCSVDSLDASEHPMQKLYQSHCHCAVDVV